MFNGDCNQVSLYERAGKSHTCNHCKEEIKKGESYWLHNVYLDFDWDTMRDIMKYEYYHLDCHDTLMTVRRYYSGIAWNDDDIPQKEKTRGYLDAVEMWGRNEGKEIFFSSRFKYTEGKNREECKQCDIFSLMRDREKEESDEEDRRGWKIQCTEMPKERL